MRKKRNLVQLLNLIDLILSNVRDVESHLIWNGIELYSHRLIQGPTDDSVLICISDPLV